MWIYVPSISSLSVQVPEDWTSECEQRAQMLAPSVTLKSKPTHVRSLKRAWQTKPWMKRLFSRICDPSMAGRGVESWIASLAATRASHSASPANAEDQTTSVTCGLTLPELSAKYHQKTFSSKTSPTTYRWGLMRSAQTYRKWAISLRLEYSARRKSAPAIGGSGCSSWPTINADDARQTGGMASRAEGRQMMLNTAARMWPTPYGFQAGNGPDGNEFSTEVRQWTTPKALTGGANSKRAERGAGGPDLQEQAKAWPTPAARDYKGSLPLDQRNRTMDTLDEAAERKFPYSPPDPSTPDGPPSLKARRTLNPRFVEWLLGWPSGWTDCDSAVTGLSHYKQRMRTELSTLCSRTPAQASLL